MKNIQYRLWALLIGVTLGVLLFVIIPVHADIVTVPDGLNPGDLYRLAFVTSSLTHAGYANITIYNDFVTGVANSVVPLETLGATWTAIASTPSIMARDNTDTNPSVRDGVPIYNLGGDLVAIDNADLWDGIINSPISINEGGNEVSTEVWTGTEYTGHTNSGTLGDPTNTSRYGDSTMTDDEWVDLAFDPEYRMKSMYVLSSELTAPVPIPSAVWLLSSGLIALVGLRKKFKK